MRGAGNHIELLGRAQQGVCLTVQLGHDLVVSAHDQERRNSDPGKILAPDRDGLRGRQSHRPNRETGPRPQSRRPRPCCAKEAHFHGTRLALGG